MKVQGPESEFPSTHMGGWGVFSVIQHTGGRNKGAWSKQHGQSSLIREICSSVSIKGGEKWRKTPNVNIYLPPHHTHTTNTLAKEGRGALSACHKLESLGKRDLN